MDFVSQIVQELIARDQILKEIIEQLELILILIFIGKTLYLIQIHQTKITKI